MQTLLEKFSSIFLDLENSYNENKDKLNCSNRAEYLKKVCYDRQGNFLFSRIKNMLLEESKNYKDEELDKYTSLIEIMNSLEFYLNAKELGDIKNLNKLIYDAIDMKISSSDVKLTQQYLDELRSPKSMITTMNSKDMFEKYGEVSSFCKLWRKKVLCVKLKENFDNNFLSLTEETLGEMVKLMGEEKFFINDFQKRASSAIIYISNSRVSKFEVDCICDKSLVDQENKIILGRKVTFDKVEDILVAKYRGHNIYLV